MKNANLILYSSIHQIRKSSAIFRFYAIVSNSHFSNGSSSGISIEGFSGFFSSAYFGCFETVWIKSRVEDSIILVYKSQRVSDSDFKI